METEGGHSVVGQAVEYQYADMPHSEIKWCTVTLSDVIRAGKRLEAAVFDIRGKHAREVVANCKWESVPLAKLSTKAYYPGRFKRIYCEAPNGIPFILPSQMTDVHPKAEKNISALTKCDISELRLKFGDILLTRSGTIGSVTVVSKTLEGAVCSDDVIRVTPAANRMGYLYVYLRSATGNTILQTTQYGSVINHIEPEHLAEMPVPNPTGEIQDKINDLIVRSFELRDQSNELVDKATAMLIAELRLPPLSDFEMEQFDATAAVNNYTVKLSELAGRIDGSYHIPLVKAIAKHLKSHAAEVTTVGDKRVSKDIVLPGRFKRVYVEEGQGRVFFGGKQLGELDPAGKKYLSLIHHGERIKKQLELSENMTLITCSGTIGKVMLVSRHWNNWAASQHIIRIVPADKAIAGYISVFLSSEYGHELITRFTYGSVVDEIDDRHVAQIPFPLLKNAEAQTEINRLALQANKLRYQAYLLEQEAMTVMNDEVLFV
jgi:type I restriction enzyme S subunit